MAQQDDRIISTLLAHQQALAEFGSFAFRSVDLQAVLDKAAQMCAIGVDAPYCKICRFRAPQNDLLIEAGFGWQPEIVGSAVSKADVTSPGGRAFVTHEPVICPNLAQSEGFVLPPFYAQHRIVSTVNVIIQGDESAPYGILEIDHTAPRAYQSHDIAFLTGFANVLAEAVASARQVDRLRAALAEKDALSRELQHRVRNNLHLIHAMLHLEARRQPAAEVSFRAIGNRVQALAAVYEHLLGAGAAQRIAFHEYVAKLCDTLRQVQPGSVELIQRPMAAVTVNLETATAMGIAITELISNSYRHAFPDGRGTVEVGLDYLGSSPILTVQDNGIGIDTGQANKREGLGLARRLAEQVGGSMVIERTHQGTRCDIALPVAAAENLNRAGGLT